MPQSRFLTGAMKQWLFVLVTLAAALMVNSVPAPASRPKRQAYLPYFPYQAVLPPIYQVHNIILNPVPFECRPVTGHGSRPWPPVTPGPPAQQPPATDDDALTNRFGAGSGGGSNSTRPQAPSKCVWSIVACCSPGSKDIRYACFELLGCPGAFWDVNPCDEKVVTAAANSALNYYMNNQSPTPEPTFQNL